MPLVRIEMIKGRSAEYKKTLLDCVHQGLVDALQIEDWDRFQRIVEYDKENFEIPSFKTEAFMIIELTIFPGRTKEQKKAVIEKVTSKVSQGLKIEPTDIFIIMNEPPLENWGMGGNQKG